MALRSGVRLGPYEIAGSLGAGGMGEVYRARDPRLGRDVAVKALPVEGSRDAERIARFEREAQILAALNHPHIAAIYGLEEGPAEAGGPPARFLILELVEGGTLADKLAGGPLPVAEALTLAREVADALQAAHDKGIIHRDLKPGNIGLTRDGHAKVLDFGLAKTMVATSDAATAAHATEHGMVLGTARYMSPEQTRGLPLDKRTDIWSYGCVWFEALTGRHPFGAETSPDTLAAILGRDPDWSLLPAEVPARVQWLLRRCLEKDPRRRLHDIADARIELDDVLARRDSGQSAGFDAARQTAPRVRVREGLAWIVAVLGLAAALGSSVWNRDTSDVPPTGGGLAVHASVVFPPEVRLSVAEDPSARFAISPDGRRLAVVATDMNGESRLWVRPVDGVTTQPLAGTEGATHPFWSADSKSVGFLSRSVPDGLLGQSTLKRIDLATGQVRTLGPVSFMATPTWNREGVLLFTPTGSSPIHRMPADGGPSSPVTTLNTADGEVLHTAPFFLADGRHFLFSAVGSRTGGATHARGVYLGSLDSSEPPKLLLDFGTNARIASGHLMFVRNGQLVAQRFDTERLQLAAGSASIVIAERVLQSAANAAAFSVSENGVVAYQSVVPVGMQLGWFSRTGQPLGTLGGVEDYSDVVLSSDGMKAAVSMLDPTAGTRDIWVYDVTRGHRERITSHPADDFAPVWSPTGDRLVFSSVRTGQTELYLTSSSSTDKEAALAVPGLIVGKFASHWAPDGGALIFVAGHRILARSDLWILPMIGDSKPSAFVETTFVETQPRFSPDGRWITYTSNESGRLEVSARLASGAGVRQPISLNGGRYGLWRKDGTEIFFMAPDNQLMAASIRTDGDRLLVGAIRPLFRIAFYRYRLDAYPYAVTPDGQRFLVNTMLEETAPPAIGLIANWTRLIEGR